MPPSLNTSSLSNAVANAAANLPAANVPPAQMGGSLMSIAQDPGVMSAALLTLAAVGVISMNKKKGSRRGRGRGRGRRSSRRNQVNV